MYRQPNPSYVPVYQTSAQSLLSGGTSLWQVRPEQTPHLGHPALPATHFPTYQQPQLQQPQLQQPQLQPQQSLLPQYQHGSIQPAGSLSAPSGVSAAPAPGTSAFGFGQNIFGIPPGHSMPTASNQESPTYAKTTQASPDEKNSRNMTPGSGTPTGGEDTAYVLQLSSRDFHSPTIKQFLGKWNVQIDDTPATPADPVSPAVTVKSEPDITPQEVTVKQPSSKQALHLDKPFMPKLVKKEEDSNDNDLIIVDTEDAATSQTITPPPRMTVAQVGGQRLTDGYV